MVRIGLSTPHSSGQKLRPESAGSQLIRYVVHICTTSERIKKSENQTEGNKCAGTTLREEMSDC